MMANRLKAEKKELIVKCLVDGMSVRAIERITGVHRDTIIRLMVRLGNGCMVLLDEAMRGLDCKRIEVDEIWSFVQKKQKTCRRQNRKKENQEFGDTWVFVAIDPEKKIVPSHRVGKRTAENATEFLRDVKKRMSGRIQLSSDALMAYVDATEDAFGDEVDYGQLMKDSDTDKDKVSLDPKIAGEAYIGRSVIQGKPDPRLISTALVERQNLTMRMLMRRFTRKTNGFSKTLANHKAAVALHFGYYNFARVHQTIKTAPAANAGVTSDTWSLQKFIKEAEQACG